MASNRASRTPPSHAFVPDEHNLYCVVCSLPPENWRHQDYRLWIVRCRMRDGNDAPTSYFGPFDSSEAATSWAESKPNLLTTFVVIPLRHPEGG